MFKRNIPVDTKVTEPAGYIDLIIDSSEKRPVYILISDVINSLSLNGVNFQSLNHESQVNCLVGYSNNIPSF